MQVKPSLPHKAAPMPSQSYARTTSGVFNAVGAYLIWGLSPVYFKWLLAVPAIEILTHRMIWSCLLLMPIVMVSGGIPAFKAALSNRRAMGCLCLTTLLVGGNWFLFIWAINHDQILQTSLGYYINPLVNIILGTLFLREHLRPMQWLAVFLAATGVIYLTLFYGAFPWIAMVLAISFGLYGMIRKIAPVGALEGLAIETMLLALPATGYLLYLGHSGRGAFWVRSPATSLLLMGTALVTAIPLLLFTRAARRLHLTTIGFLQYIAPSCTFLLAIAVYGETMASAHWWTFVMIWLALICYSADAVKAYRRNTAGA